MLTVKITYSTKVKCDDGRIVEINPIPNGWTPDERIVKLKAKAKELGLQPPYPPSPQDLLRCFETGI